MISFSRMGGKGYKRQLILDTEKDVENLPINAGMQGSIACVIESGNKYICNHLGEWSLMSSGNGGGSGSGGSGSGGTGGSGSGTGTGTGGNGCCNCEQELVYDGGLIGEDDTEEIVIYDGMEVL